MRAAIWRVLSSWCWAVSDAFHWLGDWAENRARRVLRKRRA
jgi:hypothetical protein